MLAVFVLLRYKYLRKPSNYPQNRNFPEKSVKKIKGAFAPLANKRKQRLVFRHPPFLSSLAVQFL